MNLVSPTLDYSKRTIKSLYQICQKNTLIQVSNVFIEYD